MCFGGILFITSLCLLLFDVKIDSIYISIFAYGGIILFTFCGFFTVCKSIKDCFDANHEEDHFNEI
jgi:hypothetical protein